MDELSKVHQLNEYLKKLEEGKLDLERVADNETASLLKLADYLQGNLVITSSPGFRQQVKENTLVAWQKRRLNKRRRLTKIIALAAAFLLLLSSLASATWRSQPGNLLYPVKRAIQKAVLLLTEKSSQLIKPDKGKGSGSERRKEERKERPEGKEKEEKAKGKVKRRQTKPPGKKEFQPIPSHRGSFDSSDHEGPVKEGDEESVQKEEGDSDSERSKGFDQGMDEGPASEKK